MNKGKLTKLLLYLTLFLFNLCAVGQSNALDTILYKFRNGKDSVRVISCGLRKYKSITYFENGNVSSVSYRIGKRGKYGSYSFYASGKPQHRSKEGLFRTLREKEWDEQGRLIGKRKIRPFGSTTHHQRYFEKTYNIHGQLIKYEYMREVVACFGGEIKKNIVIEYDDKGKVKSKIVRTKRSERKRKKHGNTL